MDCIRLLELASKLPREQQYQHPPRLDAALPGRVHHRERAVVEEIVLLGTAVVIPTA